MSLHLIDPQRAAWPLADATLSRALEASAQATLAPHALMQRAGEAVARWALALRPHAPRWWACAGPGNNGGDALVAATWLHRRGRRVQVRLWAEPDRLPPDAADALRAARAAGVPIAAGGRFDAGATDVVLDGLLGLGLARAPDGAIGDAIAMLRAAPCTVLAIDLPSGLRSDTGTAFENRIVPADATLSLLSLKPGLWTAEGRDHAGAVWFDDLGVPAPAAPSAWLVGGPAAGRRLARVHASHKGRYGDVQVIGGAAGMTGAAVLAARAALAAGAGRVHVALLDEAGRAFDATRPELMWRPAPGRDGALPVDQGVVLCGCGGGAAVGKALPGLLAQSAALVLDADALNAVAGDAQLASSLAARAARGQATVLTPHPLEAARLLGLAGAGDVQVDRLRAAESLADRYQTVVVLKGSGSIVAAPGAVAGINPTGDAALATAGTGDVLAGWIAGLWAAEGPATADGVMSPPLQPLQALVARAVFQHGHAAGGAVAPLRAADLVERLHASSASD